jgi:hypothetical protein
VNFLVDAQPQHVNDVGLAGAEDFVIWNHALASMPSSSQKTKTLPSGPHERLLGQ